MAIPLDSLRNRLESLKKVKEQTRALHNAFFDLHLAEEIVYTHNLLSDLDIRIQQLEMLITKHSDKAE